MRPINDPDPYDASVGAFAGILICFSPGSKGAVMPSGTPLNSLLSRPLWALGFLPRLAFVFPDLRRFFDSPIFYISRH